MLKVTTLRQFNKYGRTIRHEWHWHFGDAALCKGDSTASAAEQNQAAFSAALTDVFKQQFAKQSQVLDFLMGKMEPLLANGGTGLFPDEEANLRTQSSENTATQFGQAEKNLQARAFILGNDRQLPGGGTIEGLASLEAARAAAEAGGQREIGLYNANLRRTNFFNAASVLSGNAATLNPTGYAGAANQGFNNVAGLSQAVTQANGPGWGSILGGIIGGGATAWLNGGGGNPFTG